MDINQVRFGSYSIGNAQVGAKKQGNDKGLEQNNNLIANENVKQFSADDVLNAMNIAGLQNRAQINVARKEINPTDYLSAERIAEIEAMMGKFDDGVEQVANVVEQEFPGLEDDTKLALAAQVFAKE